jgi:hypothetical protein
MSYALVGYAAPLEDVHRYGNRVADSTGIFCFLCVVEDVNSSNSADALLTEMFLSSMPLLKSRLRSRARYNPWTTRATRREQEGFEQKTCRISQSTRN